MVPSFVNLGQIPGADTATNWIKAQVGAFYQLPLRITNLQEKAIKLQKVAGDKGIKTEQLRAYGVATALSSLKGQFDTTEVKLSSLLTDLKTAGLGALPISTALSAIPLSATMLYLFKSVDYNETVLTDIDKKILSPGERASLFGGGFGIGRTAILILGIATAAFFFWKGRK